MNDDQKQEYVRKEDVEALVKAEVGKNLRDIVGEEVDKAEDKRFKQLKIFAFIGLTGVFGICSYLVDKTLSYKLDQRVGQMAASLELTRFFHMATKLDYKTNIPPTEISEIMRFLRKGANEDRIRGHPDLGPCLSHILYNFVSYDMTAEIDEIFKLYEKEILTSPGLVETLLHHYGQALTARVSTPAYVDDILLNNFLKLERAGRKPCPHVSLYYSLLVNYRQYMYRDTKSQEHVKTLIDESKLLDLESKAWFIYNLLYRTRAANWQDNPNSIGKAIQPVAVSLLSIFGHDLEDALGTDRDFFTTFLKENPPNIKTLEDVEKEEKANKDKAKVAVDSFLSKQPKPLPLALQGGFRPY